MGRWLTLILCVTVFCAADYFAARWGQSRDRFSLAVVLLVGPFAYLLFGHLAAMASLTKMVGYVSCGIVMGGAVVGVFLLDERPNRMTWLGLVVVVAGLVLLSLGKVAREGT